MTEAGTAGRRGPRLPGGVSVGCAVVRVGRTKPAAHCGVRRRRGGAERLPTVGAADCASPVVACAAWLAGSRIKAWNCCRRVLHAQGCLSWSSGDRSQACLCLHAQRKPARDLSMRTSTLREHSSTERGAIWPHERIQKRKHLLDRSATLGFSLLRSNSPSPSPVNPPSSLNTRALTATALATAPRTAAVNQPSSLTTAERSTHHHHPTRHSTWPTTPSPTS